MMIGDLVWAYGQRGLILKVHREMYRTEYFVYWFEKDHALDFKAFWIQERHLIKVC